MNKRLSPQKIAELSAQRGWSQNELARQSGLGSGTLAEIIKRCNPTLKNLIAIAAALEVELDDLLEDTSEDEQPHQLAAC